MEHVQTGVGQQIYLVDQDKYCKLIQIVINVMAPATITVVSKKATYGNYRDFEMSMKNKSGNIG